MKLVIVGGVAGGASAATRARRLDESAEIVVLERGPDVSFANCGMPYYIGEEIKDRHKLVVVTPQLLRDRFRLDIRTEANVEHIDPKRQIVTIRNTATDAIQEEKYDKLILATGAAPLRPPLPGLHLPGIMTLRNLQDMDRIKSVVDSGVGKLTIIGAGFIGLELAENMVRRGIETTVVELQHQVLPPLDPEMTTPIADELRNNGVKLLLGESASAFTQEAGRFIVHLKSGMKIVTDLVILGIGVQPENQLAKSAGLAIGERGGIVVDEYLKTSDPNIFAVGDAIETLDFTLQTRTQIPLAGPANRQGRIAADNVMGRRSVYRGTQGTAIVRIFGQTAASTGASEKTLQRLGRPYHKVYAHPGQHAGYYPGSRHMHMKLLFEPSSGQIIGAQVVGPDGVDKRIDVLSVAIQAGMTVFDLEEMELAYSPQYGSAKDAINMIGFVAAGYLRGDHPQKCFEEFLTSAANEHPPKSLIDVRSPEEYARGHVPGANNIPIDRLRERILEIPKDLEVGVYCQVGQRGYLAARILLQNGYSVVNLSGGFETYQLLQRPISKSL